MQGNQNDFKKDKHSFYPVVINGKDLSVVKNAKILGVTISNDLKWNDPVEQAIKKANSRLYFLVQLRRAGVGAGSLIKLYCTVIRLVLEYGAQVFHHKLQDYFCEDLERVQKQALSIIAPDLPYQLCLDSFELESLSVRREKLCCKLFNEISDEQHNLHSLLLPRHHSSYNLRRQRTFSLPGFKTECFKKTFIPAMCSRHKPALPI